MPSTPPLCPGRLFCFGLGFSALTLARRLVALGWDVAGTCRTPDKAAALREEGVPAWVFGLGESLAPDGERVLAEASYVLLSVPPDDAGDPVLRACASSLVSLAPRLAWAGYLSSTGVYGDAGGAWVHEDSPLNPVGPRQVRRAGAERGWLDLHQRSGLPVHVFRLAGIYGPGRSALDTVRSGTARRVFKPGHVFSRIHVEDIAGMLEASMARPVPGRVYNGADSLPAPAEDVVSYACTLLGAEPPPLVPFSEAILSPMAASFWADNKRVCNRRMLEELGVVLRYPDYRAGLRALWEDEQE